MYKVFGIIALAAILTFSIAACGSPSGGPSGSGDGDGREAGVYETVRNNVTFTLTISPPGRARSTHLVGDTYVLVVKDGETEQISSGVVAEVRENDVVLQPSFKDAPPFTVRKNLSNGTKTSITGTITFDCGATRGGFAAPGGGGGGSSGGGGGSSGGGGSNTHSHSWGNWSITTFPTTITGLNTNGVETRSCTGCSGSETRTLTVTVFKTYFYGTWFFERSTQTSGTPPSFDHTMTINENSFKIISTTVVDDINNFVSFDIDIWEAIITNTGPSDYPHTDDQLADYPIGFLLSVKTGTFQQQGFFAPDNIPLSSLAIYMHPAEGHIVWQSPAGVWLNRPHVKISP